MFFAEVSKPRLNVRAHLAPARTLSGWGRRPNVLRVCLLVGLSTFGCCGFGACPPASQYPTARAAIDKVRDTHACVHGLRGEASLDYFDPERRVRVNSYYQVAHPANLRFDLVSPLGTPLSTLTVDESEFRLLDREARAFHVGVPNACNVERFLRVPVPPEVLVQLLAGVPPVLAHAPEDAHIGWEDGGYVVSVTGDHGTNQRLVFEIVPTDHDKPYAEQRLRLTEVRVAQKGVTLYRAELRDYASAKMASARRDPDGLEPTILPSGPTCGSEVPRRIRFEIPISERDVVFEQKNAEHNPPLVADVFRQEQPPGVRRETSVCR